MSSTGTGSTFTPGQWPSSGFDLMAGGPLLLIRSLICPCLQFGINARNLKDKYETLGGNNILYCLGFLGLMIGPCLCSIPIPMHFLLANRQRSQVRGLAHIPAVQIPCEIDSCGPSCLTLIPGIEDLLTLDCCFTQCCVPCSLIQEAVLINLLQNHEVNQPTTSDVGKLPSHHIIAKEADWKNVTYLGRQSLQMPAVTAFAAVEVSTNYALANQSNNKSQDKANSRADQDVHVVGQVGGEGGVLGLFGRKSTTDINKSKSPAARTSGIWGGLLKNLVNADRTSQVQPDPSTATTASASTSSDGTSKDKVDGNAGGNGDGGDNNNDDDDDDEENVSFFKKMKLGLIEMGLVDENEKRSDWRAKKKKTMADRMVALKNNVKIIGKIAIMNKMINTVRNKSASSKGIDDVLAQSKSIKEGTDETNDDNANGLPVSGNRSKKSQKSKNRKKKKKKDPMTTFFGDDAQVEAGLHFDVLFDECKTAPTTTMTTSTKTRGNSKQQVKSMSKSKNRFSSAESKDVTVGDRIGTESDPEAEAEAAVDNTMTKIKAKTKTKSKTKTKKQQQQQQQQHYQGAYQMYYNIDNEYVDYDIDLD